MIQQDLLIQDHLSYWLALLTLIWLWKSYLYFPTLSSPGLVTRWLYWLSSATLFPRVPIKLFSSLWTCSTKFHVNTWMT